MQCLLHFFREAVLHATEKISHCIIFPLLVLQGEVVIGSTSHPPVTSYFKMGRGEDVGERIVIHADNKRVSVLPVRSQIFMELLCDSPLQCKELLFVGMIPLLSLIHGSTGISHWMVPTIILLLRKNSSKAFPGGIHLQQERFLEVRESQHWSIHTLFFEGIECL